MNGNSNSQPESIVRLGEKSFQIRWNIQRNDRTNEDNSIIESWNYEYSEHPTAEVSRKTVLTSIIRDRYDADDEIALAMRRPEDVQKFAEHEDYIVYAKTTAAQIITEYEAV